MQGVLELKRNPRSSSETAGQQLGDETRLERTFLPMPLLVGFGKCLRMRDAQRSHVAET